MTTKHIVIEESNSKAFEEELNKTSSENKVFATQTHVTNHNGIIVFHAVCFIKGE